MVVTFIETTKYQQRTVHEDAKAILKLKGDVILQCRNDTMQIAAGEPLTSDLFKLIVGKVEHFAVEQ